MIFTFLGSYRSKTSFSFLKSIWVCSVAKKNHLTSTLELKPINIAFSLWKQAKAHIRVPIHLRAPLKSLPHNLLTLAVLAAQSNSLLVPIPHS